MIQTVSIRDARFPIGHGHGSDAIHRDPLYSYAVTQLHDDQGRTGTGLAFTLGEGNQLVCEAARFYAQRLIGQPIDELMARFGALQRELADEQQFRWLGPHKGVVQLALASVTNACWDLWARTQDVPLWKLLLDLSPEQIVATLDLSYLEDELTPAQALGILRQHQATRPSREIVLKAGYPGYDTSVGWFNYDDERVRENCQRALANGFTALKLKVGSRDPARDLRRAGIVREVAGNHARVMLDANQQWTLPQALDICQRLRAIDPFWIEEPTHPDDVLGHKTLADAIAPTRLALGEHVPNRVVFKNYLQANCAGFIQVDAVRVAGVSEFIAVSVLCRKFGVPVVPHVGDMGQLHQHLVLFNHIALGHEVVFLEHIPHLRDHFVHPCLVEGGVYHTPQEAGASCELKPA
ncbi:MAG TPA: enolase C-terminal domain-like protein [Candidatus Binatia bacterium]|jgi:L-fuconate dehydratase|nr:enolase C-terminal domain-like protein [Candidatus Binatia bacterium]